MSINLGSTSISNAYLGSTGVTAIYLGSTEVWTSVSPIPIGADTFKIGGLGGTLTSSSLASKLTGETLTYYVSQSGDIFVSSSTSYTINNIAFRISPQLTSYIDGGRCTSIGQNAFQSDINLVSASFPNVTTLLNGVFSDSYNLSYVSFPKVTTISDQCFYNTGLAEVNETMFPSASTVNYQAFTACGLLVSASLPKVTTIGISAFAQSPGSLLQYINFPSASSIGANAFESCDSLVSASLPAATTIGDGAFASCTNLSYVSLPSLSGNGAIGGTEAATAVFDFVPNNGQIYVPSYYSQSNAGGVNGTLNYLSSSAGWTINWL